MSNTSYLTVDSAHPLISCDQLQDELILYNLSSEACTELMQKFRNLTGKEINPRSDISHLSGGQKVILMALLVLLSPAPRIRFLNLFQALDPQRKAALQELFTNSGKIVLLEDITC